MELEDIYYRGVKVAELHVDDHHFTTPDKAGKTLKQRVMEDPEGSGFAPYLKQLTDSGVFTEDEKRSIEQKMETKRK